MVYDPTNMLEASREMFTGKLHDLLCVDCIASLTVHVSAHDGAYIG